MTKSILKEKSYSFAIKVVNLSKYLISDKKDYVLSKQFLKSGTAIGALIREAEFAQSRADFINKMSVSLKEANETEYWLSLLKDTMMIPQSDYEILTSDCSELIAMLISSIKTAKSQLNNSENSKTK